MIEPGEFTRMIRKNDVSPNVLIGYRKDGSTAVQAYRYPIEDWTEKSAKAHCKEKGGRFDAAINRSIREAAGKSD